MSPLRKLVNRLRGRSGAVGPRVGGVRSRKATGGEAGEMLSQGTATELASEAVLNAQYLVREANESGTRVAVISPALGGGFFFDCEEAERRLSRNFPELPARHLRRLVKLMQTRVRAVVSPPTPLKRANWAHGWRDDW